MAGALILVIDLGKAVYKYWLLSWIDPRNKISGTISNVCSNTRYFNLTGRVCMYTTWRKTRGRTLLSYSSAQWRNQWVKTGKMPSLPIPNIQSNNGNLKEGKRKRRKQGCSKKYFGGSADFGKIGVRRVTKFRSYQFWPICKLQNVVWIIFLILIFFLFFFSRLLFFSEWHPMRGNRL